MLDTRMPPISPRSRRSYSSARTETRLHASPARNQGSGRSQAQRVPEQTTEEPARRALPSARSSRLGRSEMRLMGIATTGTAVVCALLLVYLAAYAQVTQLGIAQSSARLELRHNQLRSQLLEAERNALESPQRIIVAAVAQGMVPRDRTPVNYVAVPQRITETEQKTGQTDAQSASQGNSGGTTEDSRTAAPFGH